MTQNKRKILKIQPYWDDSVLGISNKLLRGNLIGWDLQTNNEIPSKNKSWFSQNNFIHFSRLIPQEIFNKDDYLTCEVIIKRTKKVRIYPEKQSIQKFNKYIGLCRYWYNKTIEYLRQKGTKASLYDVRKILHNLNSHPSWAFDCPQRVREHAISTACDAVKNAKKKFIKGGGFQKIKYKSKKNPKQWFGFDKVGLNENYIFGSKNKIYFKATEEIRADYEGTKVVCESGRWFLILPQKRQVKIPENQRFGVVALDPGVRTFQTYYSEFLHGKIGEQAFTKIYKLCLELDKLISKTSKAKNKSNMKKAQQRIRWKIKDLIRDLHYKTANFLVKNFDVILIPTFETSQMVSKLRSKTSRMMLTLAHYRFKQFLKVKAEEYGCLVIEVNEAYTSKTCSYCGAIKDIGSQKLLKCKGCGVSVDRDLNGSRGIYLRELAASPIQTGNRLYAITN